MKDIHISTLGNIVSGETNPTSEEIRVMTMISTVTNKDTFRFIQSIKRDILNEISCS